MKFAMSLRAKCAGVALAVASTMSMSGPASAVEAPEYPSPAIDHVYTFYDDDGPQFTYGHVRLLEFAVKDAVIDTTLTLELFGCGGAPVGTFTGTGTGAFEVLADLDAVREKIGPELGFRATWSAPGFAPHTKDGSTSHPRREVGEQICAGTFVPTVEEEYEDAPVASWSKRIGKAKVGRTVRISPTIAPGARVRYYWALRPAKGPTKHLGNGKTLSVKVRPWMRGGRLSVDITVSKKDYYNSDKALSFGIVR